MSRPGFCPNCYSCVKPCDKAKHFGKSLNEMIEEFFEKNRELMDELQKLEKRYENK